MIESEQEDVLMSSPVKSDTGEVSDIPIDYSEDADNIHWIHQNFGELWESKALVLPAVSTKLWKEAQEEDEKLIEAYPNAVEDVKSGLLISKSPNKEHYRLLVPSCFVEKLGFN